MNAIQNLDAMLSERQAAAALNVSRWTLMRDRRAGLIEYVQLRGRVLYTARALRNYTQCATRRRAA